MAGASVRSQPAADNVIHSEGWIVGLQLLHQLLNWGMKSFRNETRIAELLQACSFANGIGIQPTSICPQWI
jgi:hypothetical protein